MRIVIRNSVIFFLIALSSCHERIRTEKQAVFFYFRSEQGINGYNTYFDHLVITGYENNKMLARDFLNVALKYLDTVKADKPVSAISFIGRSPDGHIPKGNWSTIPDQRKYLIIDFGFSNNFEINRNKPLVLNNIGIWKNAEFFDFYNTRMDSVLNSPVLLNNGND